MANVIVLAGGDSDEREISLLSGASVIKALLSMGHNVTSIDPQDGLDKKINELKSADVVFPVLHGKGGEDGTLQLFLENNDINFVGSNSQASKICFDKKLYADLLQENHILTPKTEKVDEINFQHTDLAKLPYVLKPNDGGSSIDTFIVRNVEQADKSAIDHAFQKHKSLLLQQLINGTEITVSVLGDEALAVIEIIPPTDAEFDYEYKYNGKTQELCPPANVLIPIQLASQLLAKKIHELTGCRDMSRTDIIIDSNQNLYVLETNTIPGLTDQSLLPKAAAQAGISMPELCDQLVNSAIERRKY